jgi:hypothetical protein
MKMIMDRRPVKTELFTLNNCTNQGTVGKAIKVLKDGIVYMIPTSQVHQIHDDRIVMTAWIAKQKGFI